MLRAEANDLGDDDDEYVVENDEAADDGWRSVVGSLYWCYKVPSILTGAPKKYVTSKAWLLS